MTMVHDILKQMPGLGQPQRQFLATLFVTILVLRGRVNFRNLSRYCDYSERTIARQFREPFAWPDFHQRVLMTALDPRSAIAVPLVARGRTLGALTFAWSESGRRYEETDLALAEEVARRAALAIDNARLYRSEQAVRSAAEEAQRRVTFVAEASATLSRSLDYAETLGSLARLAVPEVADWCLV